MIKIITDSTSDISQSEAASLGIEVVPLKVLFGEQSYREGIDITMDEFYDRLERAEQLPTTSQPSPADFLPYFEAARDAGDGVVAILLSGKISGTVQSAHLAKDMAGYDDIHIVDSRQTITGLRLLVMQAIALANDRAGGMDAAQVAAAIEEMKGRVKLLAMVDTLDYLHKGGRLSKASTIAGKVLDLKPIITLDNGIVSVVGKARGVGRAAKQILDMARQHGEIENSAPVYFGYTKTPETCDVLVRAAQEGMGLTGEKYPVGCVIGTHAGPGACVVVYLGKNRV